MSLRTRKFIRRVVVMLQREFAEREVADPGDKSYRSLPVKEFSLLAEALRRRRAL